MMAARPVIHAVDAANDPVLESRCGYSVPPDDREGIAAAMRRVAALTVGERESMGANGRQFVLANHDYRVLAKRFAAALCA